MLADQNYLLTCGWLCNRHTIYTSPSNCWRNHIATWEIINDSLFLIKLSPCDESKKSLSLNVLFGEESINDKVFAKWFENYINIPEISFRDSVDINLFHIKYLDIQNGILIDENYAEEYEMKSTSSMDAIIIPETIMTEANKVIILYDNAKSKKRKKFYTLFYIIGISIIIFSVLFLFKKYNK